MNNLQIEEILNSDLPNDEILINILSKIDEQTPFKNIHICPMCESIMDRFKCPICDYMDDTFSDCPEFYEKSYRTSIYKRKIHFNELLHTLTAQEKFCAKPELLKSVIRHLKSMETTPQNIQKALFRLGLNHIYKHSYSIYRDITNKTFIYIPMMIIEQMKEMFMIVEIEYRRKRIKKPFFNYMFLVHKFNEILKSNIQNLPTPRGFKKRINDEILFNELNIDFSI